MARATIDCSLNLQPLINLMKDQVVDYDIGALDATTLQVLNEPGRSAKAKSYVYCFRGGPPGKEAILYEYNAHKHKLFVNDWFTGFKGSLYCDADTQNVSRGKPLVLSLIVSATRNKSELL